MNNVQVYLLFAFCVAIPLWLIRKTSTRLFATCTGLNILYAAVIGQTSHAGFRWSFETAAVLTILGGLAALLPILWKRRH